MLTFVFGLMTLILIVTKLIHTILNDRGRLDRVATPDDCTIVPALSLLPSSWATVTKNKIL
ncbi:hypothetical protein QUA54_18095 [Microcoleus sp. MOSTC5]|uniref:hypothetical protein n=1 Tax=unclassified Microcoleus TaxID=2642155 RepID=UPI002FD43AB4